MPTKTIGVGFPDSSVGKESACNAGDPGLIPGSGRSIPGSGRSISGSGRFVEEDRLPIPVFLGFPCGSTGQESACNAGNLDSIPG